MVKKIRHEAKPTQHETKSDPYADREAGKYEHPIPSREHILDYLQSGGPARFRALCHALALTSKRDQEALRRRLMAMERAGQVVCNRRGAYGVAQLMDLIKGRVVAHRDGFGFLIPEEGGEDLFLSPREMRALLHNDVILVRESGTDRRGRRLAAVVDVLERNTHRVVGRFFVEGGVGFVVPEDRHLNQDVVIPAECWLDAKPGQMVVVDLTAQPTARSQAVGRITEVLGEHMAPGLEIDVALHSYHIPSEWPLEVEEAAAEFASHVRPQDKLKRTDLRHLSLVTIDGEDAKDFDDAVYCEVSSQGGWTLWVAIADVSHYVEIGSPLDGEALQRGNSVYFPGRVVPMLPEVLSNQLCSLMPQVDRLCMVCEMSINAQGYINHFRFYDAVMCSAARLTYTEVANLLVGDETGVLAAHKKLLPHLQELYKLYKILHKARERRGAIDFDTKETRIVFDAHKKIEAIIPVQRNDAHRLIEECMLAANVCAAEFLLSANVPILYRVHDSPRAEKLADFRSFLAGLGLTLAGGDEPQPMDYKRLLDSAEGKPAASLLQTVALRSMNQAMYSPENKGHFGLAYKAYTHFTSPIRRYPDLLVHRAIRHLLKNTTAEGFVYSLEQMVQLGEHCSQTERRADEATRDVVAWLKCEFMLDKVGESYEGVISGVTGFGLFVELNDIYVEGLVHVTALRNDYYHFDSIHHRLVGKRSGVAYRLGDKLRVQVARVDLTDRKIDFVLDANGIVIKQ